MPLTLIEYQYDGEEKPFRIESHGSCKDPKAKAYKRTQRSVLQALKEELNTSKPRQAIDKLSENAGGIFGVERSSALPRNVKQAYNMKQQLKEGAVSDPYYALVLQCKEDDKAKETAYVRKVVAAPEPAAVLAFDWQMKDIAKFCTDPRHFSVFQVDPTFDLGPFSATATQYEHLLLVNRQSGKHPVMVGPLLVHQKKEKLSFKLLVDFLVDQESRLKNLRALGTDGETAISLAFKERCVFLLVLFCAIHLRRNVTDKMVALGIEESERREICADIFGVQVGSQLQEGIIDADDEEEFRVRLAQLQEVWETRSGVKGREFHLWFQRYKADVILRHVLKPVRQKAGFVDKHFTTNRVECVNSMLSDETDHQQHQVPEFVVKMRQLSERQRRNVQWAIINRGPYRLHKNLQHLELTEETRLRMDARERESYVEMVLSSDVSLTKPVRVLHRATVTSEPNNQSTDSNNGLLLLADIALANDPDTDEVDVAIEDLFVQPRVLDVSQDDLVLALGTVPSSTVEGLWKKAEWLLKTPNQVAVAPGCSSDARMVASSRNLDRPHLVIPGKAEGEFRCDKSCPQWNGLAVCSHVLATAQSTGKLLPFLQWYRNSKAKKKNGNLTALARTDMPVNPGKKGGQSTSRRVRPERLPVDDVTKREYASKRHSYATPRAFSVK